MKRSKIIAMVLFSAVILGVWFFTPVKSWLSRENLSGIRLWIESWGMGAPFVFIGLYAAACVFMMPGSVLTLAAGALFGVWKGTAVALAGATLGACAAFIVGRYLAHDVVQKRLEGRGVHLNDKIARQGFSFVVWCRLIPLIPFNLFNYACSLTSLSLGDFFMGSAVGMIPGAFAFVSIGAAVSEQPLADARVWSRIEVWGPFTLLAVLMLLPKVFKGVRDRLAESV